jgi:prolyl oligopeptidase
MPFYYIALARRKPEADLTLEHSPVKSRGHMARQRTCWTIASAFGVAALLGCSSPSSLPSERAPKTAPRAAPAPVLVEKSASSSAAGGETVPQTRREERVEMIHGKRVADPYRWLEDGDSPEVKAWTLAQNRLTEGMLHAISGRTKLKTRLEQLLEIGQISLPTVRRTRTRASRYFYTRRTGKQNQPVLFSRDGLTGADRVLFDPNAVNASGTTALDWYAPARDGALVAYGISQGGSEESTLYVRDVQSGQDLGDVIPRTRAASVCWMPDGRRFFYSRYPAPGSVPKGEEKYHRRIFEHVLGQKPERDRLVFGAGHDMTDYPHCAISPNGRWLVIRVHQGWNKSELFIADTRAPKLTFTEVTANKPHLYDAVVRDDALYVLTNEGAPRYALYTVDPRRPERSAWRLTIPEHPARVLDGAEVIGGTILTTYLDQAVSRLERFDMQGKSLGAIDLPTLGTSDGFSGLEDGSEAFYNFESFAVPTRIQRLDLKTGGVSTWEKIEAGIGPAAYEVSASRARSKDGTWIPYLMVHARGANLKSGKNPTLLYGYGGFNVNLHPRFSRPNYAWLEQGGVYVQANLRGGGEFGEEWHRAGQLDKKQNVFDDFIAVSEQLIRRKVTAPERLAIFGRSNGGLLVAAAVTQRPELFAAAVSSVPLTDMVRYERFLIAKLWASEYGTAEKADEFASLLRYSPYHRVRDKTRYPAVLFTTAASDTRVDPLHARKMTAALQHATTASRPILLRTETEAGHGAGKPISKIADEFADIFAFTLWQLGVLAGPAQSE